MKSIYIYLALILSALYSCSVQHHHKQIKKHSQKLFKKGVILPKDTVTITNSDTITTIVTKNDTTYITNTVTKTVQLEPIVEVKTRWQVKTETKYKYKTVKVENKAMLDSLNKVIKLERQTTKQVRAENRSRWWLWLLIGFGLAYVLKFIINLRSVFKNLNRNYE